MAKYSFHKGLKSNLPSTGLTEGRYYQCVDTGELYLATSSTTLVPVATGDAPSDSKQYVRKNGTWSEVEGAVRYDEQQSLSTAQKEQARTNIGTIANNDSRLSDARQPKPHNHNTSEIMSNGMEFPYTLIPNCYIDSKSPGAEISYNGWSATDYVDVSGASTIKANPSFSSSGWNGFYDADKLWISAFSLTNGNEVNIPSNAKYIRVSNNTSAMNSLVLSSGESLDVTLERKVDEAPKDGKQYARKDGAWTEVTGGGGGTTDHSQLSNLDYEHAGHTGFQPTISDLSDIRSGAEAGATAVQPSAIADMATKTWTNAQGFLTQHQSLSEYRKASEQDTIDAGKVDKVTGKGLSTNDYTTADKQKLEGLENYDDSALKGRLDDIEVLVPSQATEQNPLADKAFVNSSVQTATANFRGSYPNWASVPSEEPYYPSDYAGNKKPTVNDYLVVEDASDYSVASIPITMVWVDAVNSDITVDGATHRINSDDGSYETDNVRITTGWTWSMIAKTAILFEGREYTAGQTIKSWTRTTNYGTFTVYAASTPGQYKGTWRFKYSGNWDTDGKGGWRNEYQVNEEPFTAAQWAAIQSGITSDAVTKLSALPTKTQLDTLFDSKQDTISDLSTIRSNAQAGATAYQKPSSGIPASDLASGVIPTVPTALSQLSQDSTHRVVTDTEKSTWNAKGTYSKPSTGIPKSDLASAVQTSLGKADSALQNHQTLKTINGQSIVGSGNIQVSTTPVTEWSDTPSDSNIPSEKLVYDTIAENEEVTSAALNDLNTRLLALETSLLQLTNQILN